MDYLDTPQIHLGGAEQAHAAAEQDRRDVQHDLIDQPGS